MIDKINREIEDTFKENEELRLYRSLRKFIEQKDLGGEAVYTIMGFISFHLEE